MIKKINSMYIKNGDLVATATEALKKGETAIFYVDGNPVDVLIAEDIPAYHKFAVDDIEESQLVIKYGESIGKAIRKIAKGYHVHDHNIVSVPRNYEHEEGELE